MSLVLVTAFTLVAFAANSLFCRMALGSGAIDPATFTGIRLASGALVLWPIARWRESVTGVTTSAGSWRSAWALFAYAAAFSLAYLTLDTGTGALLLFGAVQITMISSALRAGERMSSLKWVGSLLAVAGLVYLVLPGISAPDPFGALLMSAAGIAWGVYSLRGTGARAPISMTSGNFARATPLALVFVLASWSQWQFTKEGVLLALASGTITSGLGYVLWYQALRGLRTSQASILQLLVPVLAAVGGIVFLSEHLTTRLVIASASILGGVAIAVRKRGSLPQPSPVARRVRPEEPQG